MSEQLDFDADSNKCGCGRSPTGYCIGYHSLDDAEWAQLQKDNPEIIKALSNTSTK